MFAKTECRSHDSLSVEGCAPVYAKPPFSGPQRVLDYPGRYTHRGAISNNRLISLENGGMTFS